MEETTEMYKTDGFIKNNIVFKSKSDMARPTPPSALLLYLHTMCAFFLFLLLYLAVKRNTSPAPKTLAGGPVYFLLPFLPGLHPLKAQQMKSPDLLS